MSPSVPLGGLVSDLSLELSKSGYIPRYPQTNIKASHIQKCLVLKTWVVKNTWFEVDSTNSRRMRQVIVTILQSVYPSPVPYYLSAASAAS